ncbi:MAG: hypothetical protein CMM01_22925 [Rhodopirellula sp.]|nr:hypothetical protein [Rhodopirellula sp.]
MFAASLILGITLLAFAGWLHYQDTEGWPSDNFTTELDKTYHQRRTRSRRRIHFILGGCGVAAIVAACWGPGPVWFAMWSVVMVSLFVVVGLAGMDALRTHRYMKSKLPEIREQLLSDDE